MKAKMKYIKGAGIIIHGRKKFYRLYISKTKFRFSFQNTPDIGYIIIVGTIGLTATYYV